MNSAVETLLKEINELKAIVNTVDADQKHLLRKVEDLRSRVDTLEANHFYGQAGTYVSPITEPYGEQIPLIRHAVPNDNGTLTFTYDDGRTITIGPTV